MNEFDIEQIHPNGAIEPEPDDRDYQWDMDEIPQAGVPFDWNAGYDVQTDIDMTLEVNNQGTSGSCGGQGMSKYGEVLSKVYKGDGSRRSAKFPYSQVFVPGGGSDYRSLANIYINQGMALEEDCLSYMEGGVPPTEAFMEQVGDITATARQNAAMDDLMMAYAFPSVNIDTVAQALSACKGASLLLRGSNNGTWLSADPRPTTFVDPTCSNMEWTHYVYAGGACMRNGQKAIKILNSWGESCGESGWQYLNEDYFNSGDVFGCLVLIMNPKPVALPQYTFINDLTEGQTSDDVRALQTLLAYDGEFNLAPTGFYGAITCAAVLKFQEKYQVAPQEELDLLQGTKVGPATRAKLNSMVK